MLAVQIVLWLDDWYRRRYSLDPVPVALARNRCTYECIVYNPWYVYGSVAEKWVPVGDLVCTDTTTDM